MEIVALVAVKEKSNRVPDKNIRSFCGTNLFDLKIEQLKRVFKKVVVNTNSEKLISMAKRHNVVTVKRDEYYTRDDVLMSDVYKNMAENFDYEYVAYTNVTNPLIREESYQKALSLFKENYGEIDSLVSCHDVKEYLWLDGKPINYTPDKHVRSQDLPNIVGLNFAISLISREDMIKYKSIMGKKPYFFKLDERESLDIDTPLDFKIAEILYSDLK